jgi:hypothetical protein
MNSIAYIITLGTVAVAVMMLVAPAAADDISWEEHQYENVYIRATESMLYIMRPEEGDVLTLRRSAVPDSAWRTLDDDRRRDEILVAWNETRAAQVPAVVSPPETPTSPADVYRDTKTQHAGSRNRGTPAGGSERTDDEVPFLRLKGVPLGQALQAALRPLNLDYSMEDGYLFISTPERLRTEARQSVSTRMYPMSAGLLDTLPKIVLRNPGMTRGQGQGAFGAAGSGFGAARGYQSGGSGGFGQAGRGQGGYGQGGYGQGGFGQGGFGQGGFGQGAGGTFGGGGFNQGGMGRLQQDVTVIANISDLFSNIDDRLVGEPPAVIGTGLFFDPSPRNKYR